MIKRLLRRRPPERRGEPGIVLRVTLDGSPIILADSVRLHWIAKFGGYGESPDGWTALLPGDQLAGAPRLMIEIKPIMTTDHPTGG